MTRDSVLGWILLFLVGISLFLSYSIWVSVPGNKSAVPQLFHGKSVDMDTVISPAKIVVHPGNTYHTLLQQSTTLYDRTWDFSKKALASFWSGGSVSAVQVTDDFFSVKKGIEVTFPVPLPASFLKQFLGLNTGRDILENSTISSFFLVDDSEVTAYLKDSHGTYYKLNKPQDGSEQDFGELAKLLKDVTNAKLPKYANLPRSGAKLKISGGIYVSLSPYQLPTYFVKQETVLNDATAAKFFPDFSVTRKIEENDGAVIYTDGQRGLRVYPDGALEYNAPSKRETKPLPGFYDALNTAVEFVNVCGGWPENAYLSSYEIYDKGEDKFYKFNFGIRIYGQPLVSDKDYITLKVDGNQVRSFYKEVVSVDRPAGVVSLITPIEALDIAVLQYKVTAVEDIYPVYTLSDGRLVPALAIKTPEKQVIINNPSE